MFCRLEDRGNLNSQTNTSNLEWKVKVMSLLHEQSEKLREQQETSVGKGRQGHGVRSAWRLGQWLLLDVEIISGVSGIVLIPAYLCDVFIGVRTCWSSRDGKWCVCQSTEPSSSMSWSAPAFWNTPIMFGKLAQESFGSFDQTQTQKKRIRNRAFLLNQRIRYSGQTGGRWSQKRVSNYQVTWTYLKMHWAAGVPLQPLRKFSFSSCKEPLWSD